MSSDTDTFFSNLNSQGYSTSYVSDCNLAYDAGNGGGGYPNASIACGQCSPPSCSLNSLGFQGPFPCSNTTVPQECGDTGCGYQLDENGNWWYEQPAVASSDATSPAAACSSGVPYNEFASYGQGTKCPSNALSYACGGATPTVENFTLFDKRNDILLISILLITIPIILYLCYHYKPRV